MCGNTGLVKKDGVYVCEACGTKYTQEEAKKMLVEGAVSVKGAVKIDKMTEEQNLIILARRAYKTDSMKKRMICMQEHWKLIQIIGNQCFISRPQGTEVMPEGLL